MAPEPACIGSSDETSRARGIGGLNRVSEGLIAP